jgi:hypothetical protein
MMSALIDTELEQRTALAQKLTSLVLSIRKKEGHRVRQPLQKMMVPGDGCHHAHASWKRSASWYLAR